MPLKNAERAHCAARDYPTAGTAEWDAALCAREGTPKNAPVPPGHFLKRIFHGRRPEPLRPAVLASRFIQATPHDS